MNESYSEYDWNEANPSTCSREVMPAITLESVKAAMDAIRAIQALRAKPRDYVFEVQPIVIPPFHHAWDWRYYYATPLIDWRPVILSGLVGDVESAEYDEWYASHRAWRSKRAGCLRAKKWYAAQRKARKQSGQAVS